MAEVTVQSSAVIQNFNVGQKIAQSVNSPTIDDALKTINQTINTNIGEDQSFGQFLPIIIGVIAVIAILYILLTRKKSGNHDLIALIGERYSGKTQLFIKLNGGKSFQTVPSITNNHTSFKNPSSRKTYQFIDYCGDGISKEQVLNPQKYSSIHTIVQVVDGTDQTKLGDVALFMYRLLVSKSYQKRQCNYVILLNKSDSENFLTKTKIMKRLQDQIEHVKQSRKNSPQESEQQEDYLKTTKTRFDISKSGIKIVVGAAKSGQIKELQSVLQEIL